MWRDGWTALSQQDGLQIFQQKQFLFVLLFNVPVNNYGHVEMVN